uniref:Uncharacterized protein n=1 Tax=Anguilla anguilla TaxID=7936 RepID=A0A0E9SMM1_ANGAN
MEGGLSPPPL